MIATASGPLDASQEGLLALYVSLNSPVVTVDSLPVGPARAAIAVHAGDRTTLLVRSVRTGTVAFFHGEAGLGPMSALSHAEQLGFLFDEAATESGRGIEPCDWPVWLVEIFGDAGVPAETAPAELAACLSKFRWARFAAASAAGTYDASTSRREADGGNTHATR